MTHAIADDYDDVLWLISRQRNSYNSKN